MRMKQFMLATVLVLSLGLGVRSASAAEPTAATGGTATNAVGKGASPAGVRIVIDGSRWLSAAIE